MPAPEEGGSGEDGVPEAPVGATDGEVLGNRVPGAVYLAPGTPQLPVAGGEVPAAGGEVGGGTLTGGGTFVGNIGLAFGIDGGGVRM